MSKLIDESGIKNYFKDGLRIMTGGFIECGSPEKLINLLLETGTEDITLISNTTGFTEKPLGQLVVKKRVSKVIASHIGTNAETARQMNEEEIEVDLIPQGTLVERIRCQGTGLGGILTPTGVGTIVEEGKKKLTVDGKDYLLEVPLGADLALIKAWKADEAGNLIYRYTARNFNPIMAMAADKVIVEAEEIIPVGEMEPNLVMTPGIFVDHILKN